jgi:hypothetical protein
VLSLDIETVDTQFGGWISGGPNRACSVPTSGRSTPRSRCETDDTQIAERGRTRG